jgi:CheY-like chemotaxis protein
MSGHGRLRIAIVDGFQDEREMYAEFLRSRGCDVSVFADLDAAIRTIWVDPPHAVLTRAAATVDGIELTRRIRSDGATRAVAVVLLSTRIEPRVREEALEAGADAFVLLPAPPAAVFRTIQQAVAGRSLRPDPARIRPKTRRHAS